MKQQTQQPTSPVPQPVTPPSHHKLLKIILFVISLISIATIGVSAYLGYQANQKEVEMPIIPPTHPVEQIPSAVLESEWKTYRSEEYGYEFQYPPDSNTHIVWSESDPRWLQIQMNYGVLGINSKNDEGVTLPISDWLQKKGYEVSGTRDIGGEKAIIIEPYAYSSINNVYKYYLAHNQKIFIIDTSSVDTTKNTDNIFSQILSTFRFVEEGDVKGWETYTNTQYSFSLQRPPNSTIETTNIEGEYPHQYIRIQNYTDKEVIDNNGQLLSGQYYLEIFVYDHALGHKNDTPCTELLPNSTVVDMGNVTGYRGMEEGYGDSAKFIYALCINKPSVDYHIRASEDYKIIAEKIIDSFKFTD